MKANQENNSSMHKLNNSLRRLGIQENIRPHTSGEFPQRQRRNPFFARHNPHGTRVRHFDGLPGTQICGVIDYDFNFVNHKHSRTTKPFSNSIKKLLEQNPVSLAPYEIKEKAIPMIGIVPITNGWRIELSKIIETLQHQLQNDIPSSRPRTSKNVITLPRKVENGNKSEQRDKRHLSSAASRASQSQQRKQEEDFVREVCSRQASREDKRPFSEKSRRPREKSSSRLVQGKPAKNGEQLTKENFLQSINTFDSGRLESLVAMPDYDTYVFQLLAAILQTDCAPEVQQWLVQAPLQEKELVTDLLQSLIFPEQESPQNDFAPRPSSLNSFYDDQLLQQESGIDIDTIRHYNELHQKLFTTFPQKPDVFDERPSSHESRQSALESLVSRCSTRPESHYNTNNDDVDIPILLPILSKTPSMDVNTEKKDETECQLYSHSQLSSKTNPQFNMTHRINTPVTPSKPNLSPPKTAISTNGKNNILIWRACDSVVPSQLDPHLSTIDEV